MVTRFGVCVCGHMQSDHPTPDLCSLCSCGEFEEAYRVCAACLESGDHAHCEAEAPRRIAPVAGGSGQSLADTIGEDGIFETDAKRLAGRKRFLDELERMGNPRYRLSGRPHEFGPSGVSMRTALRNMFRSKAVWLRQAYEDSVIGPAFAQRHMKRIPEPEAHYLRRWRAMREKWIAAGCPWPRPWDLLEGRAR